MNSAWHITETLYSVSDDDGDDEEEETYWMNEISNWSFGWLDIFYGGRRNKIWRQTAL